MGAATPLVSATSDRVTSINQDTGGYRTISLPIPVPEAAAGRAGVPTEPRPAALLSAATQRTPCSAVPGRGQSLRGRVPPHPVPDSLAYRPEQRHPSANLRTSSFATRQPSWPRNCDPSLTIKTASCDRPHAARDSHPVPGGLAYRPEQRPPSANDIRKLQLGLSLAGGAAIPEGHGETAGKMEPDEQDTPNASFTTRQPSWPGNHDPSLTIKTASCDRPHAARDSHPVPGGLAYRPEQRPPPAHIRSPHS